mmetsp:Transcript_14509/g.27638  ORF Transcript_14509/g.27638 Transcript_14509/m.27638 type:complete len:258 (-) Transcript_14509:691-1464(-)
MNLRKAASLSDGQVLTSKKKEGRVHVWKSLIAPPVTPLRGPVEIRLGTMHHWVILRKCPKNPLNGARRKGRSPLLNFMIKVLFPIPPSKHVTFIAWKRTEMATYANLFRKWIVTHPKDQSLLQVVDPLSWRPRPSKTSKRRNNRPVMILHLALNHLPHQSRQMTQTMNQRPQNITMFLLIVLCRRAQPLERAYKLKSRSRVDRTLDRNRYLLSNESTIRFQCPWRMLTLMSDLWNNTRSFSKNFSTKNTVYWRENRN